ncbi:hypothetical protein EJ02DRAFT_9124 [Clathrospora elynae]|uniref:Uncharacterized protein n=1 Tax=Clathrospora elynae TaxID=706981 RepID=A0A6A5T5U4_9PLEO|nr:hypothetical protein EJ02DRAFT_9124 [Clathrospora elynae]
MRLRGWRGSQCGGLDKVRRSHTFQKSSSQTQLICSKIRPSAGCCCLAGAFCPRHIQRQTACSLLWQRLIDSCRSDLFDQLTNHCLHCSASLSHGQELGRSPPTSNISHMQTRCRRPKTRPVPAGVASPTLKVAPSSGITRHCIREAGIKERRILQVWGPNRSNRQIAREDARAVDYMQGG